MIEKGGIMRPRLFGYSIGVTFCVVSLVGAISSCARLENGAEDQHESSSSSVEQEVSGPAGQATKLVPGSKLDSQQLIALFGTAIPAGVGDPCSVIGTVCSPPVDAIIRPCGGFTGECDSTGTMDILPINFICLPGSSGNVCTAVASQNQQTVGCTVPTNGKACSSGCGGTFCANYPTECAERTNLVRNCLSNGTCQNDVCSNQTFTQEIITVNGCTRETDGNDCTPHTPCDWPRVPLCTSAAVCACLLGPE